VGEEGEGAVVWTLWVARAETSSLWELWGGLVLQREASEGCVAFPQELVPEYVEGSMDLLYLDIAFGHHYGSTRLLVLVTFVFES
jgi:hypothetical protein